MDSALANHPHELVKLFREALDVITELSKPIEAIIHCPVCGSKHVDKGRFAYHPHRDHQCEQCGLTWRAAKVDTVGVARLYPIEEGEQAT